MGKRRGTGGEIRERAYTHVIHSAANPEQSQQITPAPQPPLPHSNESTAGNITGRINQLFSQYLTPLICPKSSTFFVVVEQQEACCILNRTRPIYKPSG